MYKKVGIGIAVVATIIVCIIIIINVTPSTDSSASSTKRYVYNHDGVECVITIDFSKNEYTYSGEGFYSRELGYLLKPGTTYSCSGFFVDRGVTNGWTQLSFVNHPWDDRYFLLSADKSELRGYYTDYTYYAFIAQ